MASGITRLRAAKKHKGLTAEKAKTILREGKARGKSLSKKQKKFFGFVAGGGIPTKTKKS